MRTCGCPLLAQARFWPDFVALFSSFERDADSFRAWVKHDELEQERAKIDDKSLAATFSAEEGAKEEEEQEQEDDDADADGDGDAEGDGEDGEVVLRVDGASIACGTTANGLDP